MTPRDIAVVDLNVAFGVASDDDIVAVEHEFPSGPVSFLNGQSRLIPSLRIHYRQFLSFDDFYFFKYNDLFGIFKQSLDKKGKY